jgi:hypothetical protein
MNTAKMKNMVSRRNFIKTSAVTGAGILSGTYVFSQSGVTSGKRVGMIGLDTSHCIAFSKTFNATDAGPEYGGYKVVAAYPTAGSSDLPASIDRLAGFTEQIQQYGVEIANSIDELLEMVDVVLLETVDGRKHLEQAIPVIKAGKKMFIDKPMAASLAEAIVMFDAARYYNVPIFSSSSLRYITGMDEVKNGKIGKVYGADTYSPATLDKTHPDLFWYGIHGVEILFTAMGKGCSSVVRVSAPDTDVVTGKWNDNRIGTFRGIRSGKKGYGGTVFGETDVKILGPYSGYNSLLVEIAKFFNNGIPPVSSEETLEIMAFMEAAQESKNNGGVPVSIDNTFQKARVKSKKYSFR